MTVHVNKHAADMGSAEYVGAGNHCGLLNRRIQLLSRLHACLGIAVIHQIGGGGGKEGWMGHGGEVMSLKVSKCGD